jgi:hypothetical protein
MGPMAAMRIGPGTCTLAGIDRPSQARLKPEIIQQYVGDRCGPDVIGRDGRVYLLRVVPIAP